MLYLVAYIAFESLVKLFLYQLLKSSNHDLICRFCPLVSCAIHSCDIHTLNCFRVLTTLSASIYVTGSKVGCIKALIFVVVSKRIATFEYTSMQDFYQLSNHAQLTGVP